MHRMEIHNDLKWREYNELLSTHKITKRQNDFKENEREIKEKNTNSIKVRLIYANKFKVMLPSSYDQKPNGEME